jgi:hypothetical protein
VPRRTTLPPDDDPLSIILDRSHSTMSPSGHLPVDSESVSIDDNSTKLPKVSIKAPLVVKKVRVAFHLPVALADEARNCVYHLSGPPLRLTMAELAERAISAEIQRLQIEYNQSQPFPHRRENLKGGRPVK